MLVPFFRITILQYELLKRFEELFSGRAYLHRNSSNGDSVAVRLSEDILRLNRSQKFHDRVKSGLSVQNLTNSRRGIKSRRGDGTLGEVVPGTETWNDPSFVVQRGQIATIEIGAEVKILHKAMIKQIDRVIGDLRKQVEQFRSHGSRPISVGIVGINHAPHTVGYEGDRQYRTGPGVGPHPAHEAGEAERRLLLSAKSAFDEFVVLRYSATNEEPFDFSWVDARSTELDYAAALVRISSEYEKRF
jgi:hypothetical protein